jgi:hypothetical protein
MEEEKIPDYIKTYAKARVVISARPVLNSNHEPDVAKLVDEPLMTITLEKVLGVSTAVIRVKVNCVVKK